MTEVVATPDGRKAQKLVQIDHWIGGKHVAGTSGRKGPVYDPATGEQTKEVVFASAEEVDRAVAAARAAFPAWRATSLSKRTEIFFRIRELVRSRREERCSRTRWARCSVASRSSSTHAGSPRS
jgi:malonate-semialdehyde dehydrogenase (acetylating)/methylmalonate-semialdehyde dehydrogenase